MIFDRTSIITGILCLQRKGVCYDVQHMIKCFCFDQYDLVEYDVTFPLTYNPIVFDPPNTSILCFKLDAVNVARYLYRNNQLFFAFADTVSAAHGSINMLRFLHEIGYCFSVNTLHFACHEGHEDIVKFLLGIGVIVTMDAVRIAVENEHLPLLKYFKVGCSMLLQTACKTDNLTIVKYCVEECGAKIDFDISGFSKDVIEYLQNAL